MKLIEKNESKERFLLLIIFHSTTNRGMYSSCFYWPEVDSSFIPLSPALTSGNLELEMSWPLAHVFLFHHLAEISTLGAVLYFVLLLGIEIHIGSLLHAKF